MSELKARIDELVELMETHGLDQASLKGLGWSIEFGHATPTVVATAAPGAAPAAAPAAPRPPKVKPQPAAPVGTPVTSPMTGIYYSSSSPGAPAFVKIGDSVTAGQVVGLIEAMKVFNEITAPVSGTVLKVAADNGQLVQPGDALVYIG